MSGNLQKVSAFNLKRVETGPVQFNDDWPGVFIRGDEAMYLSLMLMNQLSGDGGPISRLACRNLVDLLQSCNVDNHKVSGDG